MTNELDRHETFDDGSSLDITHVEQWTWRDGEGDLHDDIFQTKAEAEGEAEYIRVQVEAQKNGENTGYFEEDYPLPITVVGRTITMAASTSCWKERS